VGRAPPPNLTEVSLAENNYVKKKKKKKRGKKEVWEGTEKRGTFKSAWVAGMGHRTDVVLLERRWSTLKGMVWEQTIVLGLKGGTNTLRTKAAGRGVFVEHAESDEKGVGKRQKEWACDQERKAGDSSR